MAPILNALERLPKAREVKAGAWIGRCPAHEDVNPSLSWTTGEGGAALVRCHAGCPTEAVVEAVGMSMADLFAPDEPKTKSSMREVATYPYRDEEGGLLYEVVRFEPKTFRQRRSDGRGGWAWNMNGVRRVPYRLDALVNSGDKVVFLVEGEKDVDRLRREGLVATCNVTGAGKWRDEYSEHLRGRQVAIIPDNDDPGRDHALEVAASLFGIARSVRIVELPDLPPKGDVSDWLDAGHTADELKAIIKATDWLRSRPTRDQSAESDKSTPDPDLMSLRSLVSQPQDWPTHPDEAAFAGFAGEAVDMIDPHTEADRVAVLGQFIVMFGNAVGTGPHVMVGATRHGANEYLALAGSTSKARKGDSERPNRAIYSQADPDWTDHRLIGGLGSGEALVWAVRDPIQKVTDEGEITTVDPGEPDKRLTIFEPELVRIMKIASRAGSILSPIIRDAWDRGDIRTTTKTAPARATGAHVSIFGHTTIEELRRELADVELVNGFANRFLWLAVRRSKELPEPEPFEGEQVVEIVAELQDRIAFASRLDRLARDDEARQMWAEAYHDLSADRPGLAGAVLARAEAHVLRLSLIYALLDKSTTIGARHLESALALWGYVERSVAYIFGDATGDPIADTIESALKATEATEGLTRTQIRDLFGRHEPSGRISAALGRLLADGRARTFSRETGGRPVEVWVTAP
jgi:3-oxoacyl-(acyl-carrier-protein) synthase